ncbi:transmembrane protein, putative [Medicago truncatula]|uniref:Transmembrane protein, putative n=1 Tax=Medicago truncatula TaxID=3880 RepID=G7I687_MEDTR|nr:transmembrane protein, putative [Medicago truncatula]
MAQSQSENTAAVDAIFAQSTIFAGVTFFGAGWTQTCPTNNITSDPKCRRSYFSPALQANRLRTVVIIGIFMILSFSVPHYFMEYKAVHGFGTVDTDKEWVLITSFVAAVVACLLDNTLHKGLRAFIKFFMAQSQSGHTAAVDAIFALNTIFAGVTFLGAGWTQICPTNNITSDPKCRRSYFSPAFQANRLRMVVIIGISMILSFSAPHYFMEYKAVHGFGPVHLGKEWTPMYWDDAGTSDLDLYALPTVPFNLHQYFPLIYSIYTNILLKLSLFLRHI